MDNSVCDKCGLKCEETCEALKKLYNTYNELKTADKREIIQSLRKELNIADYETADDLRELGEKVINIIPELVIIREFNIKIGYVRSYEQKKDKGREVNADCRKVSGTYTAYLPYDFIITFYEPNIYYMTENQKAVLMLHELKHIGIGERGFRIENHDIEDFKDIIIQYGLDWNCDGTDIKNILVGGDDGTE